MRRGEWGRVWVVYWDFLGVNQLIWVVAPMLYNLSNHLSSAFQYSVQRKIITTKITIIYNIIEIMI